MAVLIVFSAGPAWAQVEDVALDKRHTAAFRVGQSGVYTLVVRNLSAMATAGTTTVRDMVPAGLSNITPAGANWVFTVTGQEVVADFPGSIPANDSVQFTITVDVGVAAFPSVTNAATVSLAGDPDPTNDRDTDTTAITAPDLTIDKRHTNTFIYGQTGTYRFIVTNVGSAATFDTVAVRDDLPVGLTYAGSDAPGWIVNVDGSGQVVTAKLGTAIAAGDSASFGLTVNTGGQSVPSVTNAATASTTGDPNSANNRDTDPTAVLTPDFSITKSHLPFMVGKNGSYTITIRNAGTLATSGVYTVSDALPLGLTYRGFTGAGWSVSVDTTGRAVTATRSTVLVPGTSTVLTLGVSVGPAAFPSVTNRASVTGSGDLNGLNDVANDPTTVAGAPDLSLDKRHIAPFVVGQTGSYRFVVRNFGSVATSGTTTVTDTLPAGLTFVNATGSGWEPPSVTDQVVSVAYTGQIQVGDSVSFDMTVAVGPAAMPAVTNVASVTTANDYDATDNRDLDPTTVDAPDLEIDKRHTTGFTAGQNGSYTIVVKSAGTGATTSGITVRDTLPAGLTYVQGVGTGWAFTQTDQEVRADFGSTIAAGDSAKFTLTVAVSAAVAQSITNFATVSGGGDLTPANNRDGDPTAVAVPDLTIDKRHTSAVTVGQTVEYTIVVTNVGSGATTTFTTVRDTMPVGLTYDSGGTGGTGWLVSALGRNVTARFSGTIAAGDSAKFILSAIVTAAAVPAVTNFATVLDGGDASPANNRDADPTAVTGIPDLALDKRHIAFFREGRADDYTVIVRNLGTEPTVGTVTVQDTLPAGLSFAKLVGSGWSAATVNDQIVTTTHDGAIAAGDSAKFTLTVDVLISAAPSVTNFAVASGGGDVTPANNRDGDPTFVTGTADLTIDKRHAGPFRLSSTGSYVIVVTNAGTGPTSTTMTVRDTLPAGLNYRFAGGQDWLVTAAGQIVTATRSTPISAGDSTRFTIAVTIGAAALPTVTNSATVSGGGDVTAANNRDVDAVTITGQGLLAVSKRASPTEVEVGGVVDYAVGASNLGDGPVTGAEVVDLLPSGFRYLSGSARYGGVAGPDPLGSPGPVLRFPLGTLLARASVELTYRVEVSAGSEIGSGVNYATVRGLDPTQGALAASNTATAAVRVRPGVFGDLGLIAGKVIADCDCGPDSVQGNEDLGIPGVRLYLEDGSSAVTDAEGKYSFNHLRPRLHVVRVDESTLPAGARMKAIANRDAGSGVSQFVDLKRGELHRADFVEGSRSAQVLDAVKARRRAGEVSGPLYGDGGYGEVGVGEGSGTAASGSRGSGPGAPRPSLLALGLLNARLDWHGLSRDELEGSVHDRFEDQLRDLSHRSDDGTFEAAGRAALFLSGTVADSVRVVFRYDSEHELERRLFRDIRPDEGYQMLGDASVHGFDAQTAGRLFARLERGASFAMYGDFSTPSRSERALGAFSRRLNGGLGSLALGRTQWRGFASQGHQHQIVDEFLAQGISGPYTLSRPDGTLGSELVEILVRDRNQPAIVLRRDPQVRFVDYTLEPFTGRLMFRHPIASLDEHLNPVYIRVTYESQLGGDAFWVYGGELRVTPIQALSVSGTASRDEDPLAPRGLTSGDATLQLGSSLTLTVEGARSDSGGTIGSGLKYGRAGRAEAGLKLGKLSARLRAMRTDINFDNPSSGLTPGREEQGFDLKSGLGRRGTALFATGIRTRDLRTDGLRKGIQFGLAQTIPHGFTAEGTWRWSEEGRVPASPLSARTIPNKSNIVGGKLTAPMPWLRKSTMFLEGEQDITWYNRHRVAAGSDIRVTEKTRLFARHENISSLSGPFAINDFQQQEYTVVGLASDELRNGHVFSEYRLRDAAAGREALAAIGLRNRWALNSGLFADAGFERNVIVRGGSGAGTAVAGALEYTGSPVWKGTARAEWRRQDGNDQWLSGATMERKLSRDWAALGRAELFRALSTERTDSRSQFGLAYRGAETNRLSALARYDNRIESEGGASRYRRVSHVVSSHANWQPATRVTLAGQLASRWAVDDHDQLVSRTAVQMLAGRALYDLTSRFDIGATGRSEFGGGHRFGVGGELGWLAARNLRLAAGYNVFGFRDSDMSGADRTDPGPYLDFGLKFDSFWSGTVREPQQGGSR